MQIGKSSPETPAPGRGFWFMRDIPTAVWLILVVISTVTHRWLPSPRWLMIHLLLLGAITHAILVWSQYFSYALLRSRATILERRTQNVRLIIANTAALTIFIGVPYRFWWLTVAGATALVTAIVWHILTLVKRLRKSMPGQFGKTTHFYIASAATLIVGTVLGVMLAYGSFTFNIKLAHALINTLGWVGLTVAGTVVTLWPTILRTKAPEKASKNSVKALPIMILGVAVAALGAGLGFAIAVAVGLFIYLAGMLIIGRDIWSAAASKTPKSFAALSAGAALLWWAGSVTFLALAMFMAGIENRPLNDVAGIIGTVVPFLAAGFVAQILIAALSYLIPVVVGGGPAAVRQGTLAFEKFGQLRVTTANAALLVSAFPLSSLTKVVTTLLYLLTIASFLPLLFVALAKQSRTKKELARLDTPPPPPKGRPETTEKSSLQAVWGLLLVAAATLIPAIFSPSFFAQNTSSTPAIESGAVKTETVRVEAANMMFTPNIIEVQPGTHLLIELTNTDAEQTHDLVFENGITGKRLAPGESEILDLGIIDEALSGWCSIIGHKQMGMTLDILVSGSDTESGSESETTTGSPETESKPQQSHSENSPGPDFEAYDATLPVLPEQTAPKTHELTLTVEDTEIEVSPGVTQTLWTYNKTAPGPLIHGRVGDRFIITLTNSGSIGHSIDFHAGALAPDEPMRTIAPGETLTYAFTATRSGIWMYHCSTEPMSAHIANGMYGAVIIEPEDLPEVDKSYFLVQGEYYLGNPAGGETDMDKIEAGDPDLVVFNGYANQYQHDPLTAKTDERVRVWVFNAGIERSSSFHVIGGQFDTVWSEGKYEIDRSETSGSQALGLFPAQGGFVELTFPEPGNYPFVSHLMRDAERGASGTFKISDR